MIDRFIQVVTGQEKYNRPGQPVDVIPIVVYHRIDNSGTPYSTTVFLFIEDARLGINYHYVVTIRSYFGTRSKKVDYDILVAIANAIPEFTSVSHVHNLFSLYIHPIPLECLSP